MPIATKSSRIDISKEADTAILAKKFAKILKNGDVVFLYGEIGVGKTTFVRHLINNIEKKKNLKLSEVTSPTFTLLNEYIIDNIHVHHYDLFRLKKKSETKNIGIFEETNKILTLVEWPEKIEKVPNETIKLKFEYDINSEKRFIKILNFNAKFLDESK
tara:strand:- start:191 stop:667 length:477 start_codon:yes stop_codon:yes gene_type:complete